MGDEAFGEWHGSPMDSTDVDRLLTETGYGVLSLARDGEAYAIPVSFGYADGQVYLMLLRDSPDNRKLAFCEATERASLLVTDIRGRFDWESVRVDGPLRRLDRGSHEWDDATAAIDDNAWAWSSFERSDTVEEVQRWTIDADELSGLQN